MEGQEALRIAAQHLAERSVEPARVEWNMFEFGNWLLWIEDSRGKKWFVAVDDLDGDVLASEISDSPDP